MTKWGRKMKTVNFLESEWTEECDIAFNQLKEAIINHPILQLPDPDRPYEIMTDSSKFAIGSVLMQRDDDNQLKPVAFYSAKHTPAETNYPVHEFELLAIFKSLKHWRHLLINSLRTKIYTDHKPLTHILTQDTLSPRQQRWITYLADYDVDIQAVPGTANRVADCLSRYNYDELTNVADTLTAEFVETIDTEYVHAVHSEAECYAYEALIGYHQLSGFRQSVMFAHGYQTHERSDTASWHLIDKDDLKKSIVNAYATDKVSKLVMSKSNPFPDMKVVNKMILHYDRDGHETIYIPATATIRSSKLQTQFPQEGETVRTHCSLREELLRQIHEQGHVGAGKMIELVSRHYYWPRLRRSVLDFVRGCTVCQQNKQVTHKEWGRLRTLELPTRRWAFISMDFVIKLPMTRAKHDAIFVVVDQFSKRAHFIPTRTDATAQHTAQLFYENIWKLHGLPIKIVSDRDSLFLSDFWRQLMSLFGTQLAMTTPFHPSSDGLVERTNLTLKEMLRSYSDNARLDWDVFLPAAEFTYNNTFNTSLKDTPFQVDTNQTPLDTHSIAVAKILDRIAYTRVASAQEKASRNFVKKWNDRLQVASRALAEASENLRIKHHGRRQELPELVYRVGSKVWLDGKYVKYPDLQKRGRLLSRKTLDKRRLGPYEILEVIGDGTAVKLKLPPHQKFHPVQPISRIEPVRKSVEFPNAHNEDPVLPIMMEDESGEQVVEFEVEKILRHKLFRGKTRYLVKFLGFDDSYNVWLPKSALRNAPETLADYERSVGIER